MLVRAVGDTSIGKTASAYTVCHKDVVEVTIDSGEIVQKLPVCIASAGFMRNSEGWSVDTDHTRMTSMGDYSFEQMSTDIDAYLHNPGSSGSVGCRSQLTIDLSCWYTPSLNWLNRT